MTKEARIYDATRGGKDEAFKLVPNAATSGYSKACKVCDYILCKTDREPKFYSINKQQRMKAARLKYLAAVNT